MITNIRIKKMNNETRLKALASIVFDHVFVIHDIKVIEGDDKTFIAMPSFQKKNGEWVDVCHPINQEFRTVLEQILLACTKKVYESENDVINFVSQYENVPLLEQVPDDFEIENEVK